MVLASHEVSGTVRSIRTIASTYTIMRPTTSFICLSGLLLFGCIGFAAPGDIDSTFTFPSPGAPTHAVLVEPDGHIVVAGQNIIRYRPDGTVVTIFGGDTPAAGFFSTLVRQPDGKLLVGGGANVGEGYVLRFLADGQFDPDFANVQTGGNVTCLTLLPDGSMVAGGFFYNAATGRHNLVKLQADGMVDHGFAGDVQPAGVVWAVAAQDDGRVIVAGSFNSVNGSPRLGIARLRGDGNLDPDFAPELAAAYGVYALAVQPDGRILVGAEQLTDGFTTGTGISRLETDGTFDSGFVVSGSGRAECFVIQPWNGQILAGGYFPSDSGNELLIRLNPDGTRDNTFTAAIAGSEDFIESLAVQFDGKILVAGGIENPDFNPPAPNLARLENDSVPATIVFQSSSYRVAENGGPARIEVAWYGEARRKVAVKYETRSGIASLGDYRPVSGWLNFAPGERVRAFDVGIIDDLLLNEGNETVLLQLGPTRGGAKLGPWTQAVLTIAENDID
jgi:uncharacterized delta-60 repeat protein